MTDSRTLQRLAKITGRQMDHWHRQGWLIAAPRDAASSGHPFEWSSRMVRKATLMGKLLKAGFHADRAHMLSETYLANQHLSQVVVINIGPGLQLRIEPTATKEDT
jgi:hypothetical protein